MKYPAAGKNTARTAVIERLDGGINLRDGQTLCEDGQLTRSVNMWYTSGALKTRPAFCERASDIKKIGSLSERLSGGTASGATDIYYSRNGSDYRLFWYSFPTESDGTQFGFRFVSESSVFELPEITVAEKSARCLCFQYGGKIHALLGAGGIWRCSPDGGEWQKLGEEDLYAPLIMTHCLPGDSVIKGNLARTGGEAVEDFNLLCPRYRIIYSTVDKEQLKSSDSGAYHFMIYYLAESVRGRTDFAGKTVTARLTTSLGSVYTHTVTLDGGTLPVYEKQAPGDNLYMRVFGDIVTFHTRTDGTEELAKVTLSDYAADNLEITAPCSADQKKVLYMTRAARFGETVSGLSGGTRLFLGGSTLSGEQSLVLWSESDNPLYFPSGCRAYVGNADTPVTAFGKQNDGLIVFKSNEIFYTRSAKLKTQSLAVGENGLGVPLKSVYFPMIQLNSATGCDCPESIQLCRNRLIWAVSSGHIYTLLTHSRYNEKNIFEVSGMIGAALRGQPELKSGNVFSADWQGRYMLFCGGKVFIMDYNSYGFIYASSASKASDANLRIPWFYWELNVDKYTPLLFSPVVSVFTADGALKINYIYEQFNLNPDGTRKSSSYYLKTVSPDEERTADTEIFPGETGDWSEETSIPILSAFKTKLFSFGSPSGLKRVSAVKIMLGSDGREITVSYFADMPEARGNCIVIPSESCESGDMCAETGGECVTLLPPPGFCRSFGLELCSIGNMEIRSITFSYKITGGAG